MTLKRVVPVPDAWGSIATRILDIIDKHRVVLPGDAASVLRQTVVEQSTSSRLDVGVLWGSLERLVEQRGLNDQALAALTLALADAFPITSYELFARHPFLWQECAREVAERPMAFNEHSRIFREDLLYSHYRDQLVNAADSGNVSEAILQMSRNVFLCTTELGRRIAQNAMLCLLRERVAEVLPWLSMMRDLFPDMKALQVKIRKILSSQPVDAR